MSQTYGMESPGKHHAGTSRPPVRYVVIIDGGGSAIARLMLETREQVQEFEGGTPEVVQMIQGLVPVKGANDPEWDQALQAHSTQERMAAEVYTLPV